MTPCFIRFSHLIISSFLKEPVFTMPIQITCSYSPVSTNFFLSFFGILCHVFCFNFYCSKNLGKIHSFYFNDFCRFIYFSIIIWISLWYLWSCNIIVNKKLLPPYESLRVVLYFKPKLPKSSVIATFSALSIKTIKL